ncbi:MAG: hypothetical protein ISS34_08125 [Candidatus Omnitrophica bacterium]|nr:hypothetical protein [Candidatus Omnitrophota bacterium]
MTLEIIVLVLCTVAFFLLCWAMLLRLYIKELERKVEELEKYFTVKSKLNNV